MGNGAQASASVDNISPAVAIFLLCHPLSEGTRVLGRRNRQVEGRRLAGSCRRRRRRWTEWLTHCGFVALEETRHGKAEKRETDEGLELNLRRGVVGRKELLAVGVISKRIKAWILVRTFVGTARRLITRVSVTAENLAMRVM